MLLEATNSLIPFDPTALWSVIGLGLFVLAVFLPISALFSIWRAKDRMETTHLLLWFVLVIGAPIIGSIIWFATGRSIHPPFAPRR